MKRVNKSFKNIFFKQKINKKNEVETGPKFVFFLFLNWHFKQINWKWNSRQCFWIDAFAHVWIETFP